MSNKGEMQIDGQAQATIFDIQRFSIHDGPAYAPLSS